MRIVGTHRITDGWVTIRRENGNRETGELGGYDWHYQPVHGGLQRGGVAVDLAGLINGVQDAIDWCKQSAGDKAVRA